MNGGSPHRGLPPLPYVVGGLGLIEQTPRLLVGAGCYSVVREVRADICPGLAEDLLEAVSRSLRQRHFLTLGVFIFYTPAAKSSMGRSGFLISFVEAYCLIE